MAPQDNFIEEDDDTWYVIHICLSTLRIALPAAT